MLNGHSYLSDNTSDLKKKLPKNKPKKPATKVQIKICWHTLGLCAGSELWFMKVAIRSETVGDSDGGGDGNSDSDGGGKTKGGQTQAWKWTSK